MGVIMDLCDTIPEWKMPDEEKIQDHQYHVKLRMNFDKVDNNVYPYYVGNLEKYYHWTTENGIFMEHNILIHGKDGKDMLVMFVFEDEVSAMGFRLRWL